MKKGFTLIELLIVIAIIGILSSVVLASLNSARDKANNAAVKSGMASLRSQAEIFYDDNGQSYNNGIVNVCTSDKFASILSQATTTGGGPTSTVNCISDANTWAAYSNLKVAETEGPYWCVNNAGVSKAVSDVSNWATSSCQ